MSAKARIKFPLTKTTELKIRGIDGKGVWLGLKDDIENTLLLDVLQFQKAVKDEHAWFYYNEEDTHLEDTIDQWLPDGYYCQDGEIFDNGSLAEQPAANYWPLIVFLFIMFGGLIL